LSTVYDHVSNPATTMQWLHERRGAAGLLGELAVREPPAATHPATATGPARSAPELDEVLTLLDDLAEDVDALNTRIQALLEDHRPSRSPVPERVPSSE